MALLSSGSSISSREVLGSRLHLIPVRMVPKDDPEDSIDDICVNWLSNDFLQTIDTCPLALVEAKK